MFEELLSSIEEVIGNSSHENDDKKIEKEGYCSEVDLLAEMFPELAVEDIIQIFKSSDNSVEDAVEKLLVKEGIVDSQASKTATQREGKCENLKSAMEDPMKRRVLHRYFLKEVKTDVKKYTKSTKDINFERNYLFQTRKSQIRYRDGMIVSRKGEKES